jgi:hypothetical protein
VKLLVHYFWGFHERDDFVKALEDHQDKGNLLSQTNFLTNVILWQPMDEQYIIHSCRFLAHGAFIAKKR